MKSTLNNYLVQQYALAEQKMDRSIAALFCFKSLKFVDLILSGSVLLVGEGNLSFSLSLLDFELINPNNITSSTFESEYELNSLAKENATLLRSSGVKVFHSVDATKLANKFGFQQFDKIIFQFPNAGSREGEEGHNANFVLLRDFLLSAYEQLNTGGSVIVTIVDSPYYRGAFKIEDAARSAGFLPPEEYPFEPDIFEEYNHTSTLNDESAIERYNKFITVIFRKE